MRAALGILLAFAALALLSSCGLLGDSEPVAATVKVEKSAASCELPAWKALADRDTVTAPLLRSAIDCVQAQVDGAFRQLRGKNEGEISIAELKILRAKGFFDLPLDSEASWELFAEALALLHPEGRPALSQAVLKSFLDWGRRRISPYLAALAYSRAKNHEESYEAILNENFITAVDEAIELISPKWKLSLGRARTLADLTGREVKQLDLSAKNQLEAGWILKSFFLPDVTGQGPRADIDGASLRRLLRLGLDAFRAAPAIRRWAWTTELAPKALPPEFAKEIEAVSALVANYFSSNSFAAIDTRLLAWSIAQLETRTSSADLAPDLVRISQRLSPENDRHDGLHPVALLKLLAESGSIARDIAEGASAFSRCPTRWTCFVSNREAMKTPVLARVALKGRLEPWRMNDEEKKNVQSRFDFPLTWDSFIERTVRRHLVARIFSTFDRDGDGIPLRGVTEEDLEEPLDLSFTFLRLVAFGQSPPENPNKKEQSVPALVSVKPSALYRVMGLLGDRWVAGGNSDDTLDGEEFFSVMQVYDEIQEIANSSIWAMNVNGYARPEDFDARGYLRDYRRTVFRRKEFVHKLPLGFRDLPLSFKVMQSMEATTRESLMHALVGVSAQRPLKVKSTGFSNPEDKEPTLVQYLSSDAALGPAAILVAVEHLMLRCDADQNTQLDWAEMDCALPLLLDGSLQTVQSNLLELDPIVFDGARLLLTFLQTPGVPLSLAKLAAANGSLREFTLGGELTKLEEWVDSSLSADWGALARLIGAPRDPLTKNQFNIWKQEARRRFGKCDKAPKDNRLHGKEELDCFAEEALSQVAKLAEGIASGSFTRLGLARFLEMREARVFRLGLKLATQSDEELEKLLSFVPVRTTPRKLLLLLEEILRRGVPLWQMPD